MFLFSINFSITNFLLNKFKGFLKLKIVNISFGIKFLKYQLSSTLLVVVAVFVAPMFHTVTMINAITGSLMVTMIILYYLIFLPFAYYYHNLAITRLLLFLNIFVRGIWATNSYYSFKLGSLSNSLLLEMSLPTGLFGCPDSLCVCDGKIESSAIQKTKAVVEQTIAAATVPGVGAPKLVILPRGMPTPLKISTSASYGAGTLTCCVIQVLNGANVGSFAVPKAFVATSSAKLVTLSAVYVPFPTAHSAAFSTHTIISPVHSDLVLPVHSDLMCENLHCRSKSIPGKTIATTCTNAHSETIYNWARLQVVHEPCGWRKVMPTRPTWNLNA